MPKVLPCIAVISMNFFLAKKKECRRQARRKQQKWKGGWGGGRVVVRKERFKQIYITINYNNYCLSSQKSSPVKNFLSEISTQ